MAYLALKVLEKSEVPMTMIRKNDGFTLIELLLVVALVGIMVVMSVTISRNVIHQASHANGVNQLVADISSIKQSAAKENRYFAIRFNTDSTSYTIRRQTKIGVLTGWDDVSTVQPLDGKVCFDTTVVTGFAVSPMGMVYSFPVTAAPQSQNIDFIAQEGKGSAIKIIYKKKITIYSNGGIQIAK
jgi:prepilin-type N-terminal cleavage/methylation domain-containing protein